MMNKSLVFYTDTPISNHISLNPPNYTTLPTYSGIAATGSLPGGSNSAFAIPQSSFRANLHLEMASLANSVTIGPQSPGIEGANNSFAHSLSQSRMSVRSFSVAQESKMEALVGSTADGSGGHNDLQQELIEKAVVVIRRVMDKLTGMFVLFVAFYVLFCVYVLSTCLLVYQSKDVH